MHILLVGANSFIGKALSEYLTKQGHSLTLTSRKPRQGINPLDLLNPSTWTPFKKQYFDSVVLCASLTNIKECELKPELARKVNADAIAELLNAIQPKHYVTFSSDAIFDGSIDSPTHSVAGNNFTQVYAKTKIDLEARLQTTQPEGAIIRLTKVWSKDRSIIKDWSEKLNAGQNIQVFSDIYLAPVSLDYVLGFVEKVLEVKGKGIYHCSGRDNISYQDIAEILLKERGYSKDLLKVVQAKTVGVKPRRYSRLGYGAQEKNLGFTPENSKVLIQNLISTTH